MTGALVAHADPNGLVTKWSYDGFGRPVTEEKVVDAAHSITTSYAYRPGQHYAGQILDTSSVSRVETTIAAPSREPLWQTADFDAAGALVRTRSRGFAQTDVVSEEYSYDLFGRLTERSRPHLEGNSTQGVFSFGYDEMGRRVSEEAPDGHVRETSYVPAPLASGINIPRADVAALAVVRSPSQRDTVMMFDAKGRPVFSDERMGSTLQFEYGASDFLLTTLDAFGNPTRRTPDELGRLIAVLDPDVGYHRYQLDPWGLVIRDTQNEHLVNDYAYDALDRLVQNTNSSGSTNYVWDSIGGAVPSTRYGQLVHANTPQGHAETYVYDGRKGANS